MKGGSKPQETDNRGEVSEREERASAKVMPPKHAWCAQNYEVCGLEAECTRRKKAEMGLEKWQGARLGWT